MSEAGDGAGGSGGSGESFAVSRRATASRPAPSRRRSRTFTREEILEALHRWRELHGESPKMIDWEPDRARRRAQAWRAERFDGGRWPSARMVRREFGSFNAATRAAGLAPRPAPPRQRPNLSGPEAIGRAFVEWTRRYGDVPTMADWDPARARRLGQEWRIARYHDGEWPSARTVALHFGSFASAASSVGLVPRAPGGHHDPRPAARSANRRVAAEASSAAQPPGLDQLARRIRALARARRDADPVSVHAALIDLAGAALAWAEVFGTE